VWLGAIGFFVCSPAPAGAQTPAIVSINPNSGLAGGPAFSLTVNGSGFISTSQVRWNGAVRTTTFNSATSLTANSARDTVSITPRADLTITKSHTGNFTQGQVGATYTLTVANAGVGPTTAPVTVIDRVPLELTPTAAVGSGWTCEVNAQDVICSRGDALVAGAMYPPMTLTVSVAVNAPPIVTNVVQVAGGGDSNAANNSASDPTTVVPPP
jgi:hypothetical protein